MSDCDTLGDWSDEVQENKMNARVIRLMKQKLPPYIVNCVVSAGFDEVEVLSSMDTSENPGNSIEKIKFIERKFASSSVHNPFSSSPFEFSPGHRIRLSYFIREVKTLCRNKNDVKVNRKRKMESQFEKVDKQRKTTEKESTSDDESTVTLHTILDVSKHVRSDLRKWAKRQEKSYLREVQEGEHYSLHIILYQKVALVILRHQ